MPSTSPCKFMIVLNTYYSPEPAAAAAIAAAAAASAIALIAAF